MIYIIRDKATSRKKVAEVVIKRGSLGFRAKEPGFRGASGRTPARTPKSGYLPRRFPESLKRLGGV